MMRTGDRLGDKLDKQAKKEVKFYNDGERNLYISCYRCYVVCDYILNYQEDAMFRRT